MASRRNNIISLNWVFNEYSKSNSLASLNQSIGIVYEDLEYDEDPHLHCMEPTQHSWNLDPNYIKVQVVMVRIATWPSPWSHPVRLQIHHLASREPTPLHPGKWSLCALWAYLLGFVNRMARIGKLTSHRNPTLNQTKKEWSPSPTLHGGSGGCYEMAPLMAPKVVTPCAHALLHRGERFKVIECWQLGGVYRCWVWVGCWF